MTSRTKTFYAGVWYNEKDQVIFGVTEAKDVGEALRRFTGNYFNTSSSAFSRMRMLGVSNDPILVVRSTTTGLIFANAKNRWMRRTSSDGKVSYKTPWTKTVANEMAAKFKAERDDLMDIISDLESKMDDIRMEEK